MGNLNEGDYVEFDDGGTKIRGIIETTNEHSSIIFLGNRKWEIENTKISHSSLPKRTWDWKNLPRINEEEIEFLYCDIWWKYAMSGSCKYKDELYYYEELPELDVPLPDGTITYVNAYGLLKLPNDVMESILEDHRNGAFPHIDGKMSVDTSARMKDQWSVLFRYAPCMLFEPVMVFDWQIDDDSGNPVDNDGR